MTLRGLNRDVAPATLLLGGAVAAWAVTWDRMRGMDAGPGTDLGGLGWYVGIWVTMMAAMMLPSVAPMVLLFARVNRERRAREREAVSPGFFLAGYLFAWTAYGLLAYVLFRLVDGLAGDWLAWNRAGSYVAGGAIAAAGLYELTPLKEICLRHCRGPMHFVLGGWRQGAGGALRMGAEHGLFCVGCCWGLMLVLFTLGVMSVNWMLVIAAIVFAQKLLPAGERLTRVLAVVLVAVGAWVAFAPDSVPGLTQPDSPAPAMHMELR